MVGIIDDLDEFGKEMAELNENKRKKAIELVNAYFDKKEIIMKDPAHGVPDWVSIKHPEYWSYLAEFCKNVDKYKIL